MENEMMNLGMVWFTIITCLCYCYVLGLVIPKGIKRLIVVVPVIGIFLYLPLHLSSSFGIGFTSFFIPWLANFKLLLFAFGKGPLCSHPTMSLPHFVAVASAPVKIQKETLNPKPESKLPGYAIKAVMAAILMQSTKFSHHIRPLIMSILKFVQVYLVIELTLVLVSGLVHFLTRLSLDQPFDKPYLATSLQDFWSRRWNRMVPKVLKPTVYEPIRGLAVHVIGSKWASIPGILVTYFVSGLMHQLIYYYLGPEKPTVESMWFFMIQGFGMSAEVVWKKTFGEKRKLHPIIAWCLTMVFVMATSYRFFIPPLYRCNIFERGYIECNAFVNFIGNNVVKVFA